MRARGDIFSPPTGSSVCAQSQGLFVGIQGSAASRFHARNACEPSSDGRRFVRDPLHPLKRRDIFIVSFRVFHQVHLNESIAHGTSERRGVGEETDEMRS